MADQPLPTDERLDVEQRLRELDRLGDDLKQIEQALAQSVLDDERLLKLLTITGVNTIVAIGLLSAIGDIARCPPAEKLVCYFGLNRCVYQTGAQPAKHGRISERGRSWRVRCSLKPYGRRHSQPDRYAHSSCASEIGAASRLPLSQLHTRLPLWCGTS